jgi:hypothetical protein
MILPLSYDVTPRGKMVGVSSIGIEGYGDNEHFQIRISFIGANVVIDYYGDDGSVSTEEHLFEILSKSGLKKPEFVSVDGAIIELPIFIDDINGGMNLLIESTDSGLDINYIAGAGSYVEVDDAMVICTIN